MVTLNTAGQIYNLTEFDTITYQGSDGNKSSFLTLLKQKLTNLIHSPETGVEKFKNANAGRETIVKGDIVTVKCTGNSYEAATADATALTLTFAVAICISNSVPNGEYGYFRASGEAVVKIEQNLIGANAPVTGSRIYLSNITGCGTTTQYAIFARQIGIVTDATMYSTDGTVKVLIEKGCVFPKPVPPPIP